MAAAPGDPGGPDGADSADRGGATLFRHGEHFYDFQGLRAYKEKFEPVWEPRYLASPGGAALPFILANLTTLVSGGLVGTLKK